MIVLVVLGAATVVWALVGAILDWATSDVLALALATLLAFTASAHFTSARADLVRMVPDTVPYPSLVVTASGIAEVLIGAGLAFPPTRELSAVLAIVLFVALFPANVHAARQGITLRGRPPTPLIPRTFMQLLFVGVAAFVALA